MHKSGGRTWKELTPVSRADSGTHTSCMWMSAFCTHLRPGQGTPGLLSQLPAEFRNAAWHSTRVAAVLTLRVWPR